MKGFSNESLDYLCYRPFKFLLPTDLSLRCVLDPQPLVLELAVEEAPVHVDPAPLGRVEDVRDPDPAQVGLLLEGGGIAEDQVVRNLVAVGPLLHPLEVGQRGFKPGKSAVGRRRNIEVLRQRVAASVSLLERQNLAPERFPDSVAELLPDDRSLFCRHRFLGPKKLRLGVPAIRDRIRIRSFPEKNGSVVGRSRASPLVVVWLNGIIIIIYR